MKQKDEISTAEIVATPFATVVGGLLSVPFLALIALFYAWGFDTAYGLFVRPWMEQAGRVLPEIPLWQWMAVYVIIGVFKAPFTKVYMESEKESRAVQFRACRNRIGGILALIFIMYLIHWIWM